MIARKLIVSCLILLSIISYLLPITKADELDDIQTQLNALKKEYEQVEKAKKPLEGQLKALETQLAQIQASLNHLSSSINNKQKELDLREEKLVELTVIFNERVAADYMNAYLYTPLAFILGQSRLSDKLYHLKTVSENREIIKSISSEMLDLLTQKEKLEKDKAKLAIVSAEVDKNAKFIGGEVKKAKAYQAEINSKIVSLTARQQDILNQRLASLNISRSSASIGACVDDRDKDPGFSPRLAFFTYGVPNRTGLNQYGADGRGRAGQNVEQILSAYYSNYELKRDYDQNIKITTNTGWSGSIEDYVKRIYEMPASFHPEALKAQAIAARSYALAYTNNGAGSICTTEQCQVFKPEPKGGAWEEAVNATRGWVMVSGGNPVKAWYSSTHGGYILSTGEIGWNSTSWTKHGVDTTTAGVGSFGDLNSNAYDKHSPWFYCDWGSRAQYNKTAWLKKEEVADIVNTLLLIKADSSTSEHLYQVDKGNPAGIDNWDEARVRQELKNRGVTVYNTVNSVSVSADFGRGATTTVNVSGDSGANSFSGADFKNRFNLRAPGNIQIVGPLFNVESR